MKEYVVSVMALDRPGIVAAVSGAAASLGGNITHLSETVLRGYFTMIMSIETPDSVDINTLKTAVAESGDGDFQIGILPFSPPASVDNAVTKERFILTARCRDRKGVIHKITNSLADASINIDDFYAYVSDGDLIMILEIGVDDGTQLEQVSELVDQLSQSAGVTAHLQHQDIFRATTELQAVLRLQDRRYA